MCINFNGGKEKIVPIDRSEHFTPKATGLTESLTLS